MGKIGTRSAFAGALCAGVAMVGTSVHGLMGLDAELERSAVVAAQERKSDSIRVSSPLRDVDCPGGAPHGVREDRI
jgi:hypothetical protein